MASNHPETILSIQLIDPFKRPTGELIIRAYRDGELVEEFHEKNLIVDASKQIHAKLLGGAVANNSVTQISFGTSGITPVGGNTSITNPFTKAIDTVTYPTASQVSFNFSLGTSESNGKAIMEFGLLTAGNVLYARRVRASALNKESDLTLSGSWVITF
jgi:hypothetical protein